ncbi:MAG TPA: ATP-binding protein [Ruminiclostridium sp.]
MAKTLKGKISIIYVGLVILIAIVGIAGYVNLYKIEAAVDNLMTDNYKSISAATNMIEAIERQDSAMLIYINVDKQKGIDLFTQNTNDFLKWFSVEGDNVTEKGEQDLVDKIQADYNTFSKLFSELQEIKNAQGVAAASVFYDNTVMPQFIIAKQKVKDLSTLNEKAMLASKKNATQKAKEYMSAILIISALAVAGGLIIARFYANRILNPLQILTQSISRVKAGELNQQIIINSNDETNKLAKEFNEMTKRLQTYEKSTLGTLMSEKNKSVAIVKSISDPLLVLDTNYRIILINKACEDFFEVIESKTIGKHYLEVIRNSDIFDQISSMVERSDEHRERILRIHKEQDYYFNVVITMFKDTESKNKGIIVVLQDVTELKELEKVKTDFVATISHEFKTPLTSIIMAASMLSEGALGELNDEQKEVINSLEEDGEKLSELVNELLELSRIESGRAVYNFAQCSINAIVESSLKMFFDMAQRRNINLINEMDEDLPAIQGDFEKIQWVMNNLISNSLKYTNAGDFITVSAVEKDKNIFVSVKDTGAGIPAQFIDRIFDKFVQVNGRDIEVRGTGLGLSVAKEIISAHKGEIWVKSELDSGSLFTFTLPVAK